MNREEVAKLIESIPQGLDQDDFLVALATKAKEQGMERFCCDDLCEQGRDCPVRNQARLQASPAQVPRKWAELTDEDIAKLRCQGAHSVSDRDFKAIEEWLREKNA